MTGPSQSKQERESRIEEGSGNGVHRRAGRVSHLWVQKCQSREYVEDRRPSDASSSIIWIHSANSVSWAQAKVFMS